MTEASAIRYLLSKGWQVVEDGWYSLKGIYEEPVCVDTAYELQKMIDHVRHAA